MRHLYPLRLLTGTLSPRQRRAGALVTLLLAGAFAARAQQPVALPARTIESVSLTGAQNYHLSQDLLQRIQALVGRPFSQQAVDDVSRATSNELRDYTVTQRLAHGDNEDQVKVVLEVAQRSGDSAAPQIEPDSSAQAVAETNVNSRYTVEDVQIHGVKRERLSKQLAEDLQHLVGSKFNAEALDDLMSRIRRELHARRVINKVVRGDQPEHVKVVFEVSLRHKEQPDLRLSKAIYDSKQGWTAKVIAGIDIADKDSILFGLVSDGDDLLERYAGIAAGFRTQHIAGDRLQLQFLFEDYHQQWNGATLTALASSPWVPGVYRTRRSFEPTMTISLPGPLSATVGTQFNFIQTQYPTARTEAANAATGTLRYRQRLKDADGNRHEIDAWYNIRAANRSFESDFVYTRHEGNVRYKVSGDRQAVVIHFTAGRLTGRAPLFERYILGTSTTLRGWNKFDLAPLGGDHMIHNTVEYRHATGHRDAEPALMVFYDAGSVWDRGEKAVIRHAVGGGVRWGEGTLIAGGFFAAVGFPIRTGRAEPIFMVGTTF